MNSYPQFGLDGQIALVTGAARGLGRAISLALAHAGADVALGLRDINTGGELVREIEAMGRRALPLQMDVTHLDQIQRAVDDTVARFGNDEFALLKTQIDGTNDVIETIGSLSQVLQFSFDLPGHEVYATASVGVSMFPIDGEDCHTLLKNAGAAASAPRGPQ